MHVYIYIFMEACAYSTVYVLCVPNSMYACMFNTHVTVVIVPLVR